MVPCSHGAVTYLSNPSGSTANMAPPSTKPAPAPMASVAGATRVRRAVSARMAAKPQAVMIKSHTAFFG